MPNTLDSEDLASLWVTPSAQVDERILRTYLFFTRGGKTAMIPVNRMNMSEFTIFESVLDCFGNELFCLFGNQCGCPFEQLAVVLDLNILLAFPGVQYILKLFTSSIVAYFSGIVVVLGSPCLEKLSSTRSK